MTLPNESSSLTRGEKTKYRLAESMKECMCHTPVDAITVRQITENCGLTRQTFYRNFMDKFDLINWSFDKLLIKSFEYMGQGKTVQEGLQLKFSYIGEEKEFFRAAFRYDRQNSLREHDFQLIFRFYQDLIQLKTGAPASDDIRFLLEMYCHGSMGTLRHGNLSGRPSTPDGGSHACETCRPFCFFRHSDGIKQKFLIKMLHLPNSVTFFFSKTLLI